MEQGWRILEQSCSIKSDFHLQWAWKDYTNGPMEYWYKAGVASPSDNTVQWSRLPASVAETLLMQHQALQAAGCCTVVPLLGSGHEVSVLALPAVYADKVRSWCWSQATSIRVSYPRGLVQTKKGFGYVLVPSGQPFKDTRTVLELDPRNCEFSMVEEY